MSRVESGETCFPEGWGDDDAIFVDSDAVSSLQVLAYIEVFPNGRGCLKSSVRPSFLDCVEECGHGLVRGGGGLDLFPGGDGCGRECGDQGLVEEGFHGVFVMRDCG